MTTAGIEPATFRFVAQHLNHCATAVPTAKDQWLNVCCDDMKHKYTIRKEYILYNLKTDEEHVIAKVNCKLLSHCL